MNIPSTGNSGHKNRKWPKLAMLATAALLLSAISFIGIGAIPQQAFAQVTQSIEQNAENEVKDSFVIKNTQSNEQTATQSIDVRGGGNGDDSTATDANGDDDGTSVTQSIKQNAENEVKNSIVGLNEQSNVQTATQSIDVRGGGNGDD